MPIVAAVGGTIALWIACLTILARMFEKKILKARVSKPLFAALCAVLLVLAAGTSLALAWEPVTAVFSQPQQGDAEAPPAPPPGPPPPTCEDATNTFATDWGPDRPLISANPIGRSWPNGAVPAFDNVILGTPGDPDDPIEDLRIRMLTANDAEYTGINGYYERVPVVPGRTYRVRFYVINTGDRNLDTTARDTVARVLLSSCPSTDARIVGTVASSNTVPNQIWSTVHFTSDRPFRMVPADRPAKICFPAVSGGCTNTYGFNPASELANLYSEAGLAIGAKGFDGVIPGSAQVPMLLYFTPQFQ
jgi:hypothetical protein